MMIFIDYLEAKNPDAMHVYIIPADKVTRNNYLSVADGVRV